MMERISLLIAGFLIGGTVLYAVRRFFKGRQFSGSEKVKDKVYVVTGANCGIGKQIVRELNYRGAKIYMGCRSLKRAEEALSALVKVGCSMNRMIALPVDLSSFDSILNFVNTIKEREQKLDGLVNNAGIMFYPKFQLTADQHETMWQVNFLSNIVLCEKLLPLLEKSDDGRIVMVSSRAHRWVSSLNLDKIDSREGFDRFATYGKSKLAQIIYANCLSRRLVAAGSNVAVNSCHPGTCYTGILRYTPLLNTKLIRWIFSPFIWFFMKTPKDGAQTPLYLLLSKKLSGISGKYFDELDIRNPSLLATNKNLSNSLEQYSTNIVSSL